MIKPQKLLITLLLPLLFPTLLLAQQYPVKLIEQDSVSYQKTQRTFAKAKFEGLQKRYQSIKGIVMVGITNREGEVLLKGPDKWAPPGGAVKAKQGWEEAAQYIIKKQTGYAIEIKKPVLVEEMHFYREGTGRDERFSAYIVHYKAAFADNLANPSDSTFKWFDKVPANAHPNHIDHIRLYLE